MQSSAWPGYCSVMQKKVARTVKMLGNILAIAIEELEMIVILLVLGRRMSWSGIFWP
jgi:hypothetical protein